VNVARIFASLGDNEQALDWLELGFNKRSPLHDHHQRGTGPETSPERSALSGHSSPNEFPSLGQNASKHSEV
jgi:hypothetical protein